MTGVAVLAALLAAGCATKQPPPANPAAPPPRAARAAHHIYVTSGGLPQSCYHNLGEVGFREPYFESVIDSDNAKTYARLRDLAQQKYGDAVDAVVDVVQRQNEVGTEVRVSGEAMSLQHGETAECALRATPAALDSIGAVAAGGITGTITGGLLSGQNSAPGAMMGGYFGAATAAGIQAVQHQQERQAFQEDLTKRIANQSAEISSLRKELDNLIERQCEREELTAAQCDEQRAELINEIGVAPTHPTPAKAGGVRTTAADAPPSDFEIQNQIQEQQETIDRLKRAITDLNAQQNAP